ncbi:hypothetical protein [Streptomyces sp. NPDC093600]|uniref:hypothetical protein n=1 Tax=Streptomyces sp. NPDC093600 TaxID=3366047 RepID=UPI003825728B
MDTYLLPLIRGERACCFSLTETDAGSDARSLRTVAVRNGEGYRLTEHRSCAAAHAPPGRRREVGEGGIAAHGRDQVVLGEQSARAAASGGARRSRRGQGVKG